MIVAALLLALAPAGATEGRWVSIGRDGGGQNWWLDAQSVPAGPGLGEPWFKIVPNSKSRSSLKDTLVHMAIRCSDGEYAILATIHHYKNGTSDDDEVSRAFQPAPPETVAEWIVRIFCAKR